MGLDISHDAWHGAYSSFMIWRQEIAKAAGLPPLELMEGFYKPLVGHNSLPTFYCGGVEPSHFIRLIDKQLPIKWSSLKPSPLFTLLYHSDCDGDISWSKLKKIADELEKLIPKLNDDFSGHIGGIKQKTEKFIKGCRLAYSKKESLKFR